VVGDLPERRFLRRPDAALGLDNVSPATRSRWSSAVRLGTTNFSGVVDQAKAAGGRARVFLWGHPEGRLHWSCARMPQSRLEAPSAATDAPWATRDLPSHAGPLAEGALAVAVMEPLDSASAVKALHRRAAETSPAPSRRPYSNARLSFGQAVRCGGAERSAASRNEPSSSTALEGMKGYDTALMAPSPFSSPASFVARLCRRVIKAEGASEDHSPPGSKPTTAPSMRRPCDRRHDRASPKLCAPRGGRRAKPGPARRSGSRSGLGLASALWPFLPAHLFRHVFVLNGHPFPLSPSLFSSSRCR